MESAPGVLRLHDGVALRGGGEQKLPPHRFGPHGCHVELTLRRRLRARAPTPIPVHDGHPNHPVQINAECSRLLLHLCKQEDGVLVPDLNQIPAKKINKKGAVAPFQILGLTYFALMQLQLTQLLQPFEYGYKVCLSEPHGFWI